MQSYEKTIELIDINGTIRFATRKSEGQERSEIARLTWVARLSEPKMARKAKQQPIYAL